MPPIEVFTKKPCSQCDMTKKQFDKNGVEYVETDLVANPKLLEEFKAMGFSSAPIVRVGERIWSGFNPDEIKNVLKQKASLAAA